MRRFGIIFLLFSGVLLFSAGSAFYHAERAHTIDFAAGKKKDKKKKKKKKKKPKPVKSDCDPKSLTRTSADSTILKKYVAIYKNLGGVCYIRRLQKMGKLEKTDEGKYTVYLGKSKDANDRMAWSTYMYCPIGKPDGSVALVQETGDTIQYCTYKNEMKNGIMYWLKPRYGIVGMQEFVNDEKPVQVIPDYDGGK